MPTPILAAAMCCGVVAATALVWKRIGLLRGVDTHPSKRLAHDLAGRTLLPPASAAAAMLALAAIDTPCPWLVPPLSALTVVLVDVLLNRLIALGREVARIREELVGLLAYAAAVCAWTWLLTPGRSTTARLATIGGLACLVIGELLFARPLALAVRCREIASTGLVPVLLHDPAWRFDQIDVLPDRDCVCVHYVGSGACASLWVDQLRAGEVDAWHVERVAAGVWRVSARSAVCYLAIVADQVVRLEFDNGRRCDAEARRVTSALLPVPPRELARLELERHSGG